MRERSWHLQFFRFMKTTGRLWRCGVYTGARAQPAATSTPTTAFHLLCPTKHTADRKPLLVSVRCGRWVASCCLAMIGCLLRFVLTVNTQVILLANRTTSFTANSQPFAAIFSPLIYIPQRNIGNFMVLWAQVFNILIVTLLDIMKNVMIRVCTVEEDTVAYVLCLLNYLRQTSGGVMRSSG